MSPSDLLNAFKTLNAYLTTDDSGATHVDHFNSLADEAIALSDSAVVCPVGDMIRIVATGTDRAKFLHNFCTNNIKAMQPGDVCEAFFTDVKAKLLAHGYLLATDNAIEIMMLPGNQDAILKHLNRYIITEDVSIVAEETPTATFAIMGPATFETLSKTDLPVPANKQHGCSFNDTATLFTTEWNSQPVAFISVNSAASVTVWNSLTAVATPAGSAVFHHQRIMEGFPQVGIDVTDANLAPEVDRVAQTICYTKGCYLGQEPIARLDAMGHVNRKLYRCLASPTISPETDGELPAITSISSVGSGSYPALAQLKVSTAIAQTSLFAKTEEGTVFQLTLH